MSSRFAYLYFMHDDPDRVRTAVPNHVANWQRLGLRGYLGGPFADPDWRVDIFEAENVEQAQHAVDADPFVQEGLLKAHWLKQWMPE